MTLLKIEQCSKRYPQAEALAVNRVSFRVMQGESVVLVGESGSGKTTLLRMIAGFEVPTEGSIQMRERTLVNDHIFVSPEKRNMGMLFQDYALFPHLTVLDNVMFGLHRLPAKERVDVATATLEQVQLAEYAARHPHQLSGGQQQRVALARALAPKPDLLLLDEPFSNLDNLVKAEVRDVIFDVIREMGISTVSVMHDMDDAMLVGDRLLLLQGGRLLQAGSPRDLYELPTNPYVARFMGVTNLFQGRTVEGGFDTPYGFIRHLHGSREEEEFVLSVRPEHWEILSEDKTAMSGVVHHVGFVGRYCEVSLLPEGAKSVNGAEPLRLALEAESEVKAGDRLFLRPKAGCIRVFDSDV